MVALGREREQPYEPYVDATNPHPLYLGFGDGPPECVRVDDPVLRPLWFGAPDLGWGADGRYCAFSRPSTGSFLIVRLEPDNEYRVIREFRQDHMLTPAQVNELCRWLVERDVRRGFDVGRYIEDHNAAVDREKERRWDEERLEIADKLAFALAKDLGGSTFDHHIGDVPWHEEKASPVGEA